MSVLWLLLTITILFISAGAILRWLPVSNEYKRKIVHIGAGLVFFIGSYFLNQQAVILASGIFLLFLILSHRHGFLAGVHRVDRKTWGEFYYPISVGLAAWLFLPHELLAFQFGVLVLGLSDGLAEVIGKRFGRHQIGRSKKTWEGTGTFFLTTVLIYITLVLPSHPGTLFHGILISLILSTVELVLDQGLDNLALPLVGGILAHFLL